MRSPRLVASLAAVVGLAAVAFGAYGVSQIDSVESTLAFARAFRDTGGDIARDAWRNGVRAAMTISLGFGLLSLTAAVGLFLRRSFGKYLWLALVLVAAAIAVPEALVDQDARLWLFVCGAVFVLSWIGLRGSRASDRSGT